MGYRHKTGEGVATKKEKYGKRLWVVLSRLTPGADPAAITDTVDLILEMVTNPPPKPKKEGKTDATLVWEAYSEAYGGRYGIQPRRGPQVLAFCKTLVQAVGKDESPNLVRYYLTVEEFGLIRDYHPLKYLVNQWQKYFTQLKTGKQVSIDSARKRERIGSSANAGANFLRRKHGTRP